MIRIIVAMLSIVLIGCNPKEINKINAKKQFNLFLDSNMNKNILDFCSSFDNLNDHLNIISFDPDDLKIRFYNSTILPIKPPRLHGEQSDINYFRCSLKNYSNLYIVEDEGHSMWKSYIDTNFFTKVYSPFSIKKIELTDQNFSSKTEWLFAVQVNKIKLKTKCIEYFN